MSQPIVRPEAAQLVRLLSSSAERHFQIISISGPGGVGKSFLLDQVLSAPEVRTNDLLKIYVDAEGHPSFSQILDGRLFPRRLTSDKANSKNDYFPQVRRIILQLVELQRKATAEVESEVTSSDVKQVLKVMIDLGQLMNRGAPVTKKYFNAAALGKEHKKVDALIDAAWKAGQMLTTLKPLAGGWLAPLKDAFGLTRINRLRTDLFGYLSDAATSDLTAAISGYPKKDRFRPTHPRIQGLSGLLLILDDYEALEPALAPLLLGGLVSKLSDAPFKTTLLVIGRDNLEDTHPGWAQHCKQHLSMTTELRPFPESDARTYLQEKGVDPADIDECIAETRCYPFLLDLVAEDRARGASRSALFLRKFYERTTRWMSDTERSWFEAVCYLDSVNEDTIRLVIDDVDPTFVQEWFMREASIRDPSTQQWCVRPLIRSSILRYLESKAPSRHEAMKKRAGRAASEHSTATRPV